MNNMHTNTHKNSKCEVVRKQTEKFLFRNCVLIESELII